MEEIKKTSDSVQKKNLPAIRNWCSTGCTVLDLAISNQLPGGIPIGRIVQCYGGSSTCKSVLATTILGYAQRNGMLSYYDDVEQTLDPAFAEMYGLNCSDDKTLTVLHSTTLEELFDTNIKEVVLNKKLIEVQKVYAVDSITALPTEVDLKADMEKGSYGMSRAKQTSVGLRKYNFPLANNNMTLFCIDQTRDNVSGYGEKEITSGGRGLEFYSSVRIYLKTDTKIVNASGKSIGIWVKFVIKKNKVSTPFREGRFRILFDYGLDDIWSNLYFLSEDQNGEAAAKKKLTKVKFAEKEGKISTLVRYVEENCLEETLIQEVWKVWRRLYKAEERKPRKW
ncbi:MAG: hypothetical protein ACTSUP_03340 [Candidatus Heimdallarchaeaceae archaeon]